MLPYIRGNQWSLRCTPPASTADQIAVMSLLPTTKDNAGADLSATSVTSTTVFVDTKLATMVSGANVWTNRTIEWITGANSAAGGYINPVSGKPENVRRIITTYAHSSQTVTMGLAVPNTITAGDKYIITSPVPSECSKMLLISHTGYIPTSNSRVVGHPVYFVCADGYKWGYLCADTGNVITLQFPIPVEIDLSVHGDTVITIDSSTTWTATSEINLSFAFA